MTAQRGQVFDGEGHRLTATVHPSAILRIPDEYRQQAFAAFVDDLAAVGRLLEPPAATGGP